MEASCQMALSCGKGPQMEETMNNIELRTRQLGRKYVRFDFNRPTVTKRPVADKTKTGKKGPDVTLGGVDLKPIREPDTSPVQKAASPDKTNQSKVMIAGPVGVSSRQFYFFCGSVLLITAALLLHAFPEEFQALRSAVLTLDAAHSPIEGGGFSLRAVSIWGALSLPVLAFSYAAALTAGYYFRWLRSFWVKSQQRHF